MPTFVAEDVENQSFERLHDEELLSFRENFSLKMTSYREIIRFPNVREIIDGVAFWRQFNQKQKFGELM